MVPPPEDAVVVRLELNVPVVSRVPPLNVNVLLALPKFASEVILTVPAVMRTFDKKVWLAPERSSVPAPLFWMVDVPFVLLAIGFAGCRVTPEDKLKSRVPL